MVQSCGITIPMDFVHNNCLQWDKYVRKYFHCRILPQMDLMSLIGTVSYQITVIYGRTICVCEKYNCHE